VKEREEEEKKSNQRYKKKRMKKVFIYLLIYLSWMVCMVIGKTSNKVIIEIQIYIDYWLSQWHSLVNCTDAI